MEYLSIILNILLFLIGTFLILLVLVQRGRGGGLAGALGGMGGQSAFGTKAGDVFTRVTVVVAAVWILLCAGAVKINQNQKKEGFADGVQAAPATGQPGAGAPAPQGAGAPAGGAAAPAPTATGAAPASNTPAPASTPANTAPAGSPTP